MRQAFFAVLTGVLIFVTNTSYALDLNANAYYVTHPQTRTVILEKNAEELIEPASLTKLMTLYMLFESVKAGVVSLDSELRVSEKAWRKGGSKMFVEVGKRVKVEDLIQGIAVVSGNDSCIVVAEHLGGSEDAFADMMTEKAREIGMVNTTFKNASGWPDPEQRTTAKDMATLAHRLMQDFPEFYKYFSQLSFEFSGIKQLNRNGLLRQAVGVDGMKTGHIEEAGYHLVSSAERKGDRLIAVVMGTESAYQREDETLKALNFAFANYSTMNLLAEGEVMVEAAPVQMGQRKTIPLIASKEFKTYMPRRFKKQVNVRTSYQEPLPAPVKAGQQVGHIIITTPESSYEIPLLAGIDSAKLGFLEGVGRHFENMFGGK